MVARLTDDLRAVLANSLDGTARLYDDRTDSAYVVIPESVYERLCSLLDDDGYDHVIKSLCGSDAETIS